MPQNMLDYRCHVPGGAIGHDFPPKARIPSQLRSALCFLPTTRTRIHIALTRTSPQFAECLATIAAQTPHQLYKRYGLPRNHRGKLFDGSPANMAERLRAQAQNLLQNGARADASCVVLLLLLTWHCVCRRL